VTNIWFDGYCKSVSKSITNLFSNRFKKLFAKLQFIFCNFLFSSYLNAMKLFRVLYILYVFQEKGSNLLDKAGNAAQSAKETVQEVGIFNSSN
jgi:hypothetical protein